MDEPDPAYIETMFCRRCGAAMSPAPFPFNVCEACVPADIAEIEAEYQP